ncbi:MAG: tail fiber domain-containing protein [Bacteroidetes bacterium]|nr:tail fiber domain-containing protein [Bacteroidota bacterium]
MQKPFLDIYGHLTSIGSMNLETWFYTKTETVSLLGDKAPISNPRSTGTLGVGVTNSLTEIEIQGLLPGITITDTDSSTGNGQVLGEIVFRSRDGSLPGDYAPVAKMEVRAKDGTVASDGKIVFSTYENGLGTSLIRLVLTHRSGYLGFVTFDGDANWDFTSDIKIKKDIELAEDMLDRVMQLPIKRYRYKSAKVDALYKSLEVIAQDVEPLFPDLVTSTQDDIYGDILSVGYTSFGVIALKAIQELKVQQDEKIADLKREKDRDIALLKQEIQELRVMIVSIY